MLRIIKDVDHANLSFIMDTGQWRRSPGASGDVDPEVDLYEYMRQTLPHSGYVRCKIYQIAGGREEVLDYERVGGVLKKGNFNGCISIVYEGREEADRAELIGKAAAHLRDVLGLEDIQEGP